MNHNKRGEQTKHLYVRLVATAIQPRLAIQHKINNCSPLYHIERFVVKIHQLLYVPTNINLLKFIPNISSLNIMLRWCLDYSDITLLVNISNCD